MGVERQRAAVERAEIASMGRLRIPSAAALIVLLLACSEDYRIDMNGFDSGLGVPGGEAARRNLRGALAHFHVPDDALDCMVAEAFKEPQNTLPPREGPAYNWTAEELNTYATTCGVDLTKLWRMAD